MERIFIERKKLLNWIVPYHLYAWTNVPCFMQQHLHFWGHILDSNKRNVNGEKNSSVVLKLCDEISQKTQRLQNSKQTSPSSVALLTNNLGWYPYTRKNKRQLLHRKYIQILHNVPKYMLITHLGDSEPQPHCQLPKTLDIIHWWPRPNFLQYLSEGHETLPLPPTSLCLPTRSTVGDHLQNPKEGIGNKTARGWTALNFQKTFP